MPDLLSLDPKTSALLVMDFQTAVVGMIATGNDALLLRTSTLIEAARGAGMRVIFIVVGFRAGYPEVSPCNQSFGPIRESGARESVAYPRARSTSCSSGAASSEGERQGFEDVVRRASIMLSISANPSAKRQIGWGRQAGRFTGARAHLHSLSRL